MGYHPAHFWQFNDATGLKNNSHCPSVVFEHGWQTAQYTGREEIRQAIVRAENDLREYLGYSVAPEYRVDTLAYPRFHDTMSHYASPIDTTGRWLPIRMRYGHVQDLGILQRTLLDDNATVTYSDLDADGYNETFTVGPIATTATDPSEIALYFSTADRWSDSAISEDWRIGPISCTFSGGNVTIKGNAWMLVKPVLLNGIGTNSLAPTAGSFVTTVDVYRNTTNRDGTTTDTSQAILHWETQPEGLACCACATGTGSSDPGSEYRAIARAGIRDSAQGWVFAGQATYSVADAAWYQVAWSECTQPDRISVRTLSGLALDSRGVMHEPLAQVVARLAAANLAAMPCGCEVANREVARWQFDLGRTAGSNDEAYGSTTLEDLSGPFGTRRGHVAAWRYVRNQRRLIGIPI